MTIAQNNLPERLSAKKINPFIGFDEAWRTFERVEVEENKNFQGSSGSWARGWGAQEGYWVVLCVGRRASVNVSMDSMITAKDSLAFKIG